ncbi:peptidoglycan-binding domain-containing protein [Geomicrobium sediminis]|uniref:Peptidoglycan hydrolase-like protein with peptidoglycan-binding domain n=1 Tax=Geomicrobium sediminis TaxID=1347788 RepID=A0ABS2P7W6_9BACL|nr:peptidoglycan-binding protein [Geomicrobium sediminis]MBM7631407.1 peptidoglycan hydrolase-like protein with peptidoglycan-binding domain [Geomicrobium sediminis]
MSKIAVVTAVSAGALFVSPSAIDAAELMRYGQQSDDVKELQIALKEQGYFNDHRATGYFGQLTLAAVRSFQADHQLAVDGIVGPKTLAKLHGDSQNEEPSFPNLNQPIELLQNGSSGEKVIALQVELKQLGYFNSRIDGFFGRITRDAVVRFQRSHGLSADGIVGPKTKQQIAIAIGTEAVPEEVAPPYEPEEILTEKNLSYGHTGDRVIELQQLLKDHGYYHGAMTGVFGQATERAVRALQSENGLAVDGIAGPDTMNWLHGNEPTNPDSDFS